MQYVRQSSPHGETSGAKFFFEYWLKEETVSKLHGADCVTVDGVKCDEAMIKDADHFKVHEHGPLRLRAAEGIWFSALDGNGVTRREKETIDFILRKYKFDEPGVKFLESKAAWLTVEADAKAAPNAIVLARADAIGLPSLPPSSSSIIRTAQVFFDDTKQRWMMQLSSGEVKAFKLENFNIEVTGEKRSGEEFAEPPAKRARD